MFPAAATLGHGARMAGTDMVGVVTVHDGSVMVADGFVILGYTRVTLAEWLMGMLDGTFSERHGIDYLGRSVKWGAAYEEDFFVKVEERRPHSNGRGVLLVFQVRSLGFTHLVKQDQCCWGIDVSGFGVDVRVIVW